MSRATLIACRAWLTAFVAIMFGNVGLTYAQTGTINPNPLQPSGVGSASDVDMSRGGLYSGRGIGRGVGPTGPALDENPADTLLKEINGSNNSRRTGRYIFGDPRRRTSGYRAVTAKIEEGAVRFDKRGAYEEAIYGSRPGSYTQARKVVRSRR